MAWAAPSSPRPWSPTSMSSSSIQLVGPYLKRISSYDKEYPKISWAELRSMVKPSFAERSLIYHRDYLTGATIVTSSAVNITGHAVLTSAPMVEVEAGLLSDDAPAKLVGLLTLPAGSNHRVSLCPSSQAAATMSMYAPLNGTSSITVWVTVAGTSVDFSGRKLFRYQGCQWIVSHWCYPGGCFLGRHLLWYSAEKVRCPIYASERRSTYCER